MKHKRLIRPVSVAAALLLTLALAACAAPAASEIIWVDRLDPPNTEAPEVNASAAVPPARPQEKPGTVPPGAEPKVLAPETAAGYTVTASEIGFTVAYDARASELADWSYLYCKVENQTAATPNLKLKLVADGAEYLSVQAVYYEMYDAGRPAVTVLPPRALRAGAQTVAIRFGETFVTGSDYQPVAGTLLKDQTLLGFMIFLDSNPTAAMTDRAGSVTFTELSLVGDDDPDLKYEEAAPFVSDWSGNFFTSCVLTKTQQESGCLDVRAEYDSSGGYPYLQANIQAFKPDYASVKMKIKTQNVGTFSVAVAHGGDTQYTFFTGAWGMTGDSFAAEREVVFDFTALTEQGKPDSFVKNLNPYALYFFMDSEREKRGGVIEITDVEFVRTSDSAAPEASAFWTTNARYDITGIEAGGKATVTYDRNNAWEPIIVNVTAYNKAYSLMTVRLKAYGTENLGLALNGATTVLKSNRNPMGEFATEQREGEDALGAYTEYTYVFDLNAHAEGIHVAQLLIYLDATEETVVTGTRTVVFESIVFTKPE